MKIKKIRFKNLNSLVGEWLVDFEHEAYSTSGIFAITGNTGAGKTTLLDSISLALFGRTSRIDSFSKSTNEIMSTQATECYAEVEIETRSGSFRCHWSQSRKKKGKGNELNDAKHEIHDLNTGAILESKLKSTKTKIEEVTGMDFHQFTRSVMLAQGQFSAFLQSEPKERSGILEKITGTKIYTEISQEVHERTKSSTLQLEFSKRECAEIILLSIEEEGRLKEEATLISEKQRNLEREVENIKSAINWLQAIEILFNQIEQLNMRQLELNTKQITIEEFRQKISASHKAADVIPLFSRIERLKIEQNQTNENLIAQKTELENTYKLNITAKERYTHSESLKQCIQKTISDSLPLIQRVKSIDQNINSTKIEINRLESKINTTHQENNKTKEKISSIKERLNEKNNTLLQLKNNQTSQLNSLQLNTNENILRNKINLHSKNTLQLQSIENQLKSILFDIDKNSKAIAQKETIFLAEQEQLRLANDSINRLSSEQSLRLQGKSIFEFHKKKSELLFTSTQNARIENLVAMRKDLVDGQPCPLCGSEHHPYTDRSPSERNNLQEQIKSLDELIEVLEKTDQEIKDAQACRDKKLLEVSQMSNEISLLNSKLAAARDSLADRQIICDEFSEQLKSLSQEIIDILRECDIKVENITQFTAAADELSQKLKELQESATLQSSIETQIVELNNDLIAYQSALSQKLEMSQNDRIELQERDLKLNTLKSERHALFGDQDPDLVLNDLSKKLIEAEKCEVNSRTELASLETKQTELSAIIDTLTKSNVRTSDELQQLITAFNNKLILHNFKNSDELLHAHLPPDRIEQLEADVRDFEREELQVKTLLHEKQRILSEEQKKSLTSKSEAELKAFSFECQQNLNSVVAHAVELKSTLQNNEKNKGIFAERESRRLLLEKETERWRKLDTLIGSRDGRKFRDFAQQITFEIMLSHANQQLSQMTDRYLLLPDPLQDLGLVVQDAYQANILRSVKNLSGGECFLASLSLALGLSKMASRNIRVDSLFLDEGFGTLDEDTLHMAIDTLANLQQAGKTVGVISHISTVKERITTQIEVSSVSRGKSKISGPGCYHLS